MQRSKEIVKISLGAQAINELLSGGLESRCITEIYGEYRYGPQSLLHSTTLEYELTCRLSMKGPLKKVELSEILSSCAVIINMDLP